MENSIYHSYHVYEIKDRAKRVFLKSGTQTGLLAINAESTYEPRAVIYTINRCGTPT